MSLQEVDPKPEVEASSCVALNLVLLGLGHPLAGRPLGMRWNVLKNHCSVEGLRAKQRYLYHGQPARPDQMNLQISWQLAWTEFGSIGDNVSQFPHWRCTKKNGRFGLLSLWWHPWSKLHAKDCPPRR